MLRGGRLADSDSQGLGCILLTLYTGQRPFPVQNSLQHLALLERVVGALAAESEGIKSQPVGRLIRSEVFCIPHYY